jgi:hypothetical protein
MSHIINLWHPRPDRSLTRMAATSLPEKMASPHEMLAAAELARDQMAAVTELIESVLHRLAEH